MTNETHYTIEVPGTEGNGYRFQRVEPDADLIIQYHLYVVNIMGDEKEQIPDQVVFILAADELAAIGQGLCHVYGRKVDFDYDIRAMKREGSTAAMVPFGIEGWRYRQF